MQGRTVGVEIAGWLHRACKRGAKEVCAHGVSQEAVLYITQRLAALLGEGAKLVVVFDGDRSYEAKAETQAKRRVQHEQAVSRSGPHDSNKFFKTSATPQEELQKAVMAWCRANSVSVIVVPYEADQQLVDLQQCGWVDTILVSSNDSDLTMYGGTDCIYDYDPLACTCMHVKLFEDILVPHPREGAMLFNGWVYDRLLVLCLLSGHDYLPGIKGCGLATVYKLMCKTAMPLDLWLLPGMVHPPLAERPAVWQTKASIRLYAVGVLTAKLAPPDVEPKKSS